MNGNRTLPSIVSSLSGTEICQYHFDFSCIFYCCFGCISIHSVRFRSPSCAFQWRTKKNSLGFMYSTVEPPCASKVLPKRNLSNVRTTIIKRTHPVSSTIDAYIHTTPHHQMMHIHRKCEKFASFLFYTVLGHCRGDKYIYIYIYICALRMGNVDSYLIWRNDKTSYHIWHEPA